MLPILLLPFLLSSFTYQLPVNKCALFIQSKVVTATAYTSSVNETDNDPWTAAWNNKLKPGDKIIAVSRDLERLGLGNGILVYVQGLGFFTVKDRMNKRKRGCIDIWFETDKKAALNFGKRKLRIYWVKDLCGEES